MSLSEDLSFQNGFICGMSTKGLVKSINPLDTTDRIFYLSGYAAPLPLSSVKGRHKLCSIIKVKHIPSVLSLLPPAIPVPTYEMETTITTDGSGSSLPMVSISNKHTIINVISTRKSI